MNPIRIDVDAVLRSRAPGVRRWLPRFVVRGLERFIRQDEMNRLLEATAGLRDVEFCEALLRNLDVGYVLRGSLPECGRATFVSNHPLGGLDGVALIALVSERYGTPVRVVVNDLLMAVEPLRATFVPINKHGAQQRSAAGAIDAAFASDLPVIMFPAGLCSRKGAGGVVADLRWNKMFVQKSAEHRRDVIPLHFDAENSQFFYNFAKLRQRLGVKFNVEMLRLPAELFNKRGRRFVITAGAPIPWQSLRLGPESLTQAQEIKQLIYGLRTNH